MKKSCVDDDDLLISVMYCIELWKYFKIDTIFKVINIDSFQVVCGKNIVLITYKRLVIIYIRVDRLIFRLI